MTTCLARSTLRKLSQNNTLPTSGQQVNTMRVGQTQCHVWFCVTGGSVARWIGSEMLCANNLPWLLLFPSGHFEQWGWGCYTCCSQVGMSQPKFPRYKVAYHFKCNGRWAKSQWKQQFVWVCNTMWGCASSVLLQELVHVAQLLSRSLKDG